MAVVSPPSLGPRSSPPHGLEQLQTSAHRLGLFVVLFLCRGSLLSSGSIVRVRRARRQQEIPEAGSETRQHYIVKLEVCSGAEEPASPVSRDTRVGW